MSRIKNNLKLKHILLLAVILIIGGYEITLLLQSHWLWRAEIQQIIPTDINGDGKPELIIVYLPHPESKRSLVEALELPGRKSLWSVEVLPQIERYSRYTPPFYKVAGERLFLMSDSSTINAERFAHVTGLDLRTGRKLWDFSFPFEQKCGTFVDLLVWKDNLIVFTSTLKGKALITILNQAKGNIIKQYRIPPEKGRFLMAAQIYGNQLALNIYLKYHILELERGKWSSLQGDFFPPLYNLPARQLHIKHDARKYSLHETRFPRLSERTLFPLKYAERPLILSSDSLLVASNPRLKTKRQKFFSLPLDGKGGGKSLRLPRGWRFPRVGYEWLDYAPEHSAFHKVDTRFMPLLLQQKDKGFFPPQHSARVVILDRKLFKIIWQSRVLEKNNHMSLSDIFKAGNRYLLRVNVAPPDSRTPAPRLLVLNGDSGLFEAVFNLQHKGPDGFVSYNFRREQPWYVHGNLFFGYKGGLFWAIDLKQKQLRFHDSDQVRLLTDPADGFGQVLVGK